MVVRRRFWRHAQTAAGQSRGDLLVASWHGRASVAAAGESVFTWGGGRRLRLTVTALWCRKSSPKLPNVVAASLLPYNSARVRPRPIVIPNPEHSPSPHECPWRHRPLAHADFLTRLPTLLYP